jgi:hypothetical protein
MRIAIVGVLLIAGALLSVTCADEKDGGDSGAEATETAISCSNATQTAISCIVPGFELGSPAASPSTSPTQTSTP